MRLPAPHTATRPRLRRAQSALPHSLSRRRVLAWLAVLLATLLVRSPAIGKTGLEPKPRRRPKRPIRFVTVGSGVTGLCASALLAKDGHDVTVLESHPTSCGGHARMLQVAGLPFCAGPQYVWDFAPGSAAVGARVLRQLGLETQVPFVSLNPDSFERVAVGSEPAFDVPMGLTRFRDALCMRFPDNVQQLRKFFSVICDLYEGTELLFARGLYLESTPDMIGAVLASPHLPLRAKFVLARYYDEPLQRLFDQCALPPIVRRILLGHCGVFAESPETLSLGVYAAATGSYHSGAQFPRDGFGSLVDGLLRVIQESGGTVATNSPVVRMERKGSLVVRVTCQDGSLYPADHVISTLSPRRTCALVDACEADRYHYQVSNPLTGCYIAVRPFASLDSLRRRNLWWQRFPEPVDFAAPDMVAPPTMLYANSWSVSRKEADAPFETEGVVLFAPGNFEQSQQACWQGGERAVHFRKEVSRLLIAAADSNLLPGLADAVVTCEVKTPWDTFHEVGAERGNGYGRRPDVHNVLRGLTAFPAARNLSLASATVGQPGVATAFQTAALLVKHLAGIEV